MPDIILTDVQVRVKDSYAPAPVINLTLRSNGEEKIMLLDGNNNFTLAGIPAPTVAPTISLPIPNITPGLTAGKWVAYRYVYAATKRYPLVENAVSAGGDISPRSNPSPVTTFQVPAAPAGGSVLAVKVTGAARSDLDAIWVYRSDYYDSEPEARTAGDAGQVFFIKSIIDTGSPGTYSFNDSLVTVIGNELVETDNFLPECFQLCVFDDPYFYGVGSFAFIANVTVDATGLVTLTNPWDATTNPLGDKWYNGRDAQRCVFAGITDGGYDYKGSFYIKIIDRSTAQLYLNKALTLVGAPLSFGATQITIQGEPNVLYRSKPRNPFSWGYVENIGEVDVPRPYAHRFGGGQATAICLVPIQNLLKIDTEGPNRTFVFNLNGKGTPAFEASKREISSDFSCSNNWCQFSAKDKSGNSYIYFFDSKFKAICLADGANNVEVSSAVFETLRNLSTDNANRLMSHGAYEPTLQLSCVWLTKQSSTLVNDIMLTYHHPSDTWSTHYQRDISCSAPFLDQVTNEQFVLLGTMKGRIGRGFKEEGVDWINPYGWPTFGTRASAMSINVAGDMLVADTSNMVGIWMNLMVENTSQFQSGTYRGAGRISSVTYNGGTNIYTFTFDKLRTNFETEAFDLSQLFSNFPVATVWLFPGSIFCAGSKMYVAEELKGMKLSEIWVIGAGFQGFSVIEGLSVEIPPPPWVYSLYGGTTTGYSQGGAFLPFSFTRDPVNTVGGTGDVSDSDSNYYYKKNPLNVDLARSVRVYFNDLGYTNALLYSYKAIFDNA